MCRLIDYMSFHLEENILWSQSILSNKMIKKTKNILVQKVVKP